MIKGVLHSIETPTEPVWVGVLYLAAMLVAQSCISVLNNHFFIRNHQTAGRVRGALMTAIYHKALRISQAERTSETGQTVNLMSNDAYAVEENIVYWHYVWISPLMVLVTLGVLYAEVGIAAIAAGVIMISLLAVEPLLGKHIGAAKQTQLQHTDQRVRRIFELLQGVRIIKMYAWEVPLAECIHASRNHELAAVKTSLMHKAVALALTFTWPLFAATGTLVMHSLVSEAPLGVNQVVTALALISTLQRHITMFPQALYKWAEARVSLRRLDAFFAQPDMDRPDFLLPRTPEPSAPSQPCDRLAIVVDSEARPEEGARRNEARRRPGPTALPGNGVDLDESEALLAGAPADVARLVGKSDGKSDWKSDGKSELALAFRHAEYRFARTSDTPVFKVTRTHTHMHACARSYTQTHTHVRVNTNARGTPTPP